MERTERIRFGDIQQVSTDTETFLPLSIDVFPPIAETTAEDSGALEMFTREKALARGGVSLVIDDRKLWREEDMLHALEDVRSGMTIRMACRIFSVPRSTLTDRVKGHVVHGTRGGPKALLSEKDENYLVQYCLFCAQFGFPLTKKQLLAFACSIRKTRNPDSSGVVGETWWRSFRKRQKSIWTLWNSDKFHKRRTKPATRRRLEQYFELLKHTLEEHGLEDKPRQIYSCEESGFKLDKNYQKVSAGKGSETVHQQANGKENNMSMSVLVCFSAAGEDVPPFCFYSETRPISPHAPGDLQNALCDASPSGYVDGESFHKWFSHFVKHAVQERPLLLILDGHKIHLNLELVTEAKKESVVLVCLPRNCSDTLQPLDKSFLGPLKSQFAKLCRKVCHANESVEVDKSHIARLLHQPYEGLKKKKAVVKGFKRCGIYPLNPDAVDYSHIGQSSSRESADRTEDLLSCEETLCSSFSVCAPPETPNKGKDVHPKSPRGPGVSAYKVLSSDEHVTLILERGVIPVSDQQVSAGEWVVYQESKETKESIDSSQTLGEQIISTDSTMVPYWEEDLWRAPIENATVIQVSSMGETAPQNTDEVEEPVEQFDSEMDMTADGEESVLTNEQRRKDTEAQLELAPLNNGDSNVRKKRNNWRGEDMLQALEKVKGGMSLREASRIYSVPRVTLGDRVRGRVVHGTRPGPKNLLSGEEEEELFDYWKYCVKYGFPISKALFMASAMAVRHQKNSKNSPLGRTWWEGVVKRNPNIRELIFDHRKGRRPVDRYFEVLSKTLEELRLKDQPGQIYSCCELPVMCDQDEHKNSGLSETNTNFVTVLMCFNAAGDHIPPLNIYPETFPRGPYKFGGVSNALYEKSPTGRVDKSVFHKWFKHFVKHALPQRPLILLFEGHTCPPPLEVVAEAKRQRVTLVCLPEHYLQAPLSVSFLGSLQSKFARAAQDASNLKNSYMVEKTMFAMVFRKPYEELKKKKKVVVEGFKSSGVYPLSSKGMRLGSGVYPLSSEGMRLGIPAPPQPKNPCSSAKGPFTYYRSPALLRTSATLTSPPLKHVDHPLLTARMIQPEVVVTLTPIESEKKTSSGVKAMCHEYKKKMHKKIGKTKQASHFKKQNALPIHNKSQARSGGGQSRVKRSKPFTDREVPPVTERSPPKKQKS